MRNRWPYALLVTGYLAWVTLVMHCAGCGPQPEAPDGGLPCAGDLSLHRGDGGTPLCVDASASLHPEPPGPVCASGWHPVPGGCALDVDAGAPDGGN